MVAVCALPDNPSAESECETVRGLAMAMKRLLDTKPDQVEQARQEGYERGKAEGNGCPHFFCNECAATKLKGYEF